MKRVSDSPAAPPTIQSLPSRRQFLTTVGSTATTFAILSPAVAFGSEANSRITAGVVGLGGRGGWIAEHVAKHAGYQVTALADYFPEVVNAAGEKLGVPKDRRFSGLRGYQGVIASKVDAIFLETPPYFFPRHARAAVEAGCHVYLAKPVAVDAPGALEILELGRRSTRNRKVFLVDFQTRTDPFHQEAIAKVQAGMIGGLGLLHSFYHDECFADPPRGKTIENLLRNLAWVNDTALGGSYIVNCDIHAIDVALWIAAQVPVSALGCGTRRRPDAQGDSDDCYSISYQFADGLVLANHSEHIRNATGFKSGCHAFGQKGYLEAHYGGKTSIRGVDDGYAGGESPNLYAEGMQRNVDTFHRYITQGAYDNPTLEPSVHSTLATLLGREAARTGRRIAWDDYRRDTRRLEVDLTGLTGA